MSSLDPDNKAAKHALRTLQENLENSPDDRDDDNEEDEVGDEDGGGGGLDNESEMFDDEMREDGLYDNSPEGNARVSNKWIEATCTHQQLCLLALHTLYTE